MILHCRPAPKKTITNLVLDLQLVYIQCCHAPRWPWAVRDRASAYDVYAFAFALAVYVQFSCTTRSAFPPFVDELVTLVRFVSIIMRMFWFCSEVQICLM